MFSSTGPVTVDNSGRIKPDLAAPGGLTYEKIEGSAVTATGAVYIINDNDGVDDNSGETQLINLGNIL